MTGVRRLPPFGGPRSSGKVRPEAVARPGWRDRPPLPLFGPCFDTICRSAHGEKRSFKDAGRLLASGAR
jgi:hypothetical protein